MVDPRFYRSVGERRISALLESVGRQELWADNGSTADPVISGVSELETAGRSDIAFATSREFADLLGETRAGVVVVSPQLKSRVREGCVGISVEGAQILFSQLSAALYPTQIQARVGEGGSQPRLEEGVHIGPNVSIGPDVDIGSGTVIGANSVIGAGVSIGRDCEIGPNCTIEYTYIGNEAVVMAGARLGVSGFGYLPDRGSLVPVPQLGRTIVQDRVEIGANTVVDRGALGDTVIGEGTKIGNLVVIAHNCRIGRHCMVVGFTGFAGSVVLEDNVTIAGGGGLAGHITVGAGSTVLAASWVAKSVPPNSRVVGAPAQDVEDAWRMWSTIQRLAREQRQ